MPFITLEDYAPQIKANNMQGMLEGEDTTRGIAEAEAISMATQYLHDLYDTDTIFSQTGADRHPHLLSMCKDIVLYKLHKRLVKKQVPDHIATDYQDCIDFLTKVQEGKMGMDLPRKQATDNTPATRFRYGSLPPRTY